MKIDEISFRHCLALLKWIIEGHKLLLTNVSGNIVSFGVFTKADLCENSDADALCSTLCQCVSCSCSVNRHRRCTCGMWN